jgi:hypothetical protein
MEDIRILINNIIVEKNNCNYEKGVDLCRIILNNESICNDILRYAIYVNMVFMLNKIGTPSALDEAITIQSKLINNIPPEKVDKLPVMNLIIAYLYSKRLNGEKHDNIIKAIEHYKIYLHSINKYDNPILWAAATIQLGLSYINSNSNTMDIEEYMSNIKDAYNIELNNGNITASEEAIYVMDKIGKGGEKKRNK